ncbi:MAG TPA: hypothetical protein VMY78_13430 [Solirubrobacteraceae bacterium]|nr:hypothetical protein [Solirubrobacteraceae bacterium]
MTTEVQSKQIQAINSGGVMVSQPFVPQSLWPELEAAREAHERALEEHAGDTKRRQDARQQERQLQEHLAAVQTAQRDARRDADRAVKHATGEALKVVAEHGEAWLAEIAEARAAALAECEELRERLQAAEARAHKDDAVEAWIQRALTSSVPQPFSHIEASTTAQVAA